MPSTGVRSSSQSSKVRQPAQSLPRYTTPKEKNDGGMMPEDSLLDDALVRLDEAAAHISIDPDVIEKLKYARETTQVRLLIRMADEIGSTSCRERMCHYV